MKRYPEPTDKRSVQDATAAADDLAVAILQDRLDDASKGRQLQAQPLTVQQVTQLRQQGALN